MGAILGWVGLGELFLLRGELFLSYANEKVDAVAGNSELDDAGFDNAGFGDAEFDNAGFGDAKIDDAEFDVAGLDDSRFADLGFDDLGIDDSGIGGRSNGVFEFVVVVEGKVGKGVELRDGGFGVFS